MIPKTTRARVVVAVPLAPELIEKLSVHDLVVLPDAHIATGALESALAGADGLLVSSKITVDRHLIAAAPNLRVISTMSAGLDHLDLLAARDAGIVVTNTPVLSDAVADLTMALITMVLRRLLEAARNVIEGRWSAPLLGHDLARRQLLIVGFGRIGRAVATRALAAGMSVSAYDTRTDLPRLPCIEQITEWTEALGVADVVSLHVDLNDGTRGLIDADALALMKPTAILVNTSRGAVVDQAALTRALAEGRIAGAGLDVLADEPPHPDEPLLSMANVVVLPHLGSATIETRAAMAQCAIDNLLAVLRDEDAIYPVT